MNPNAPLALTPWPNETYPSKSNSSSMETSVAPNLAGFDASSSGLLSTRVAGRLLVVGALSIVVGVLWDISWHRTIGRDTFWTPAHLAIYLGGMMGGLIGGWLVLRTTWSSSTAERNASVRLWGFRGPFGAWVAIWGSLAMLLSAPFDNWWHDAYGLDVKILSPPHSVLALGMWGVAWSALLLVLREQNNSGHNGVSVDGWLFIFVAGILLAMGAVFLTEHSFPNDQHSATFYRMSSATYPMYLLGLARASRARWAATWIALIYMAIMASMAWILPLFPGQPRLGPIYNHITHFVPLPFPLLLVVPAVAIDLIRNWIGHSRGAWWDWLMVVLCAGAFLLLFLGTQWSFSSFMLSDAADNWFFAGDRHWGYTENQGTWRNEFWNETNPKWHPAVTLRQLGIAFLWALGSARVGLWLGNWMSKVRR